MFFLCVVFDDDVNVEVIEEHPNLDAIISSA